jgi:hypothetical protein
MSLRFSPVVIPAATTAYSIKEYNSGVTHIVADLTGDCTFSLPTPKKGLFYRFQYGGAAADAQDWIFSAGAGNAIYFIGGVAWLTDGTPDIEVVYSDGNSNEVLNVFTPEAGTWVEFLSDGSNWYVNGQVVSTSATPTFAD